MHAVRIWGAVLVLCAAALVPTSASPSSSQRPQSPRTVRITVADLPPSATALPALNATSCRHGACTGATQPPEAPREASFATRVPDVPSSDARNHVAPSGDAGAQERVHADRVPHHSAATTHESPEDPSSFYKDAAFEHQDGDAATVGAGFAAVDADAVAGGRQRSRAYKYEDHASAAERYDASLTTPRIELFDRHHARVSQSIRQNLQELEESNAAATAAATLQQQQTEAPARKPARAPAPQPFRRRGHLPATAPGDDANVALDYTNHVSVIYNLTADPPRSANGELVLENGTHVDFTSSYVHSEIFPDDVTTQASVRRQRTKNATVASTVSNSTEDQSPGSSRIVDSVKSASIVHSAKDEDNIVVNNTSILSSNKTQPIRVTPGDNPSTTSRTTSRSQETIEVAPTTTPIPNEVLTTTAPTKSHRARFPPKRLKQGPSTTASPVTTETPPTDTARPRTRARMIASPRAPANASNSVEDAPSPSMAAIAAAAVAARKTTRYSWRRPSPPATIVTTTSAPDKEEAADDDMVRVAVSTISPNTSEPASRRLTQAARRATAAAAAAATRRGNVPADATPTPSAAVVRKFLSLRRRLPTTTTTTTTTAPTLTTAPEAATRRPSTALRRPSLATLQSRRRGSTRFGATDEDDDGGMAVPPTAAAWLLATLHGPAQSVPMPAAPAETTTTTDSEPEEVIGVTTNGADTDGHVPAPAAPTPGTSEVPNEVTDGVATPTAPAPLINSSK